MSSAFPSSCNTLRARGISRGGAFRAAGHLSLVALMAALVACDHDESNRRPEAVTAGAAGSGDAAGAAGKGASSGAAGLDASAGTAGKPTTPSEAGSAGSSGAGQSAGAGGGQNVGGSAGSTISGGSAGTAGSTDTGGSAGTAGSTISGGSAGTAGTTDTGGSAGTAGSTTTGGASSTGGTTAQGGSSGVAGSSGQAGSAGSGDENEVGGAAGESGAAGAAGDSGEPPLVLGGLEVSSTPADLQFDLFGVAGHRFWIEVSEEQVTLMNEGLYGGGWYGEGDIYTPGGGGGDTTYADHVLVEDFTTKRVADYGQLEVKLVGESTGRQWTESTIPNVRIDTDEFQEDMRIGATEHLRLNNSLVGSIFREHIAHRIYGELGYPALRSSYAFLGSSVWGADIWVPMTLMEVYKCRTLEDREDVVGGACLNMWEFPGDVAYGIPADACQNKDCDDTRLEELSAVLNATPAGPGFMDALADYIDWDMYHKFQCLSWIMWTGDDPLHNSNNNLIIERDDHRMVWAPYSVDISAGQEWYLNTPLTGSSSIPTGCQRDPACWEETIATCEGLIADFQALQPETIVDETVALLDGLGMMRNGDEDRADQLRQWFVDRQLDLPSELETYRVLPDEFGNCPDGLEPCGNGACGTPEVCSLACGNGYEWCSVYGYCMDPNWEQCPSCGDETPVWCPMLDSCVASQDECFIECGPGEIYCEMYGGCVPAEDCYYIGI